jgi:hypothetical protein
MKKKNPRIGSSFESWLDEAGIREDVTVAAIKSVIARQLANEMKKKKLTKSRMAALMKTSRTDAVALCFSEPLGSPIPRSMATNFNRRIEYP